MNIENVRKQINLNKGPNPYFATTREASAVVTDYDNFPYNRWYRGVAESDVPIVAEREAGWRPIRNDCYRPEPKLVNVQYPQHCFEAPCSTVFPCNVADIQRLSALNVRINDTCIPHYR